MSASGFTPIQLYRSATPGATPSAGNLADGELAVNTADEKLFFKNAGGTVVAMAVSAAGTVTSVAASGGTTGLTFSGSPITTSGTLTLSGTLAVANGGTGATTAGAARTSLGATTVGGNLFTLTNPSAITFPRFNADNTVSALDAATFRTAIGVSSGAGTVTSVALSGGTTGLTVSGSPITTSGTITLAGTLAVANGGTGVTTSTGTGNVVLSNEATMRRTTFTSNSSSEPAVLVSPSTFSGPGVRVSPDSTQGRGYDVGGSSTLTQLLALVGYSGTGGAGNFASLGSSTAAVFSGLGATNGFAVGTAASAPFIFATNNTERARFLSTGQLGLATTTPTAVLDVNSDTLRLRTARTPASATAAGNAGDICWDSSYIYVCVATNTWKRTAISTWP
jgi:hypothetical protein